MFMIEMAKEFHANVDATLISNLPAEKKQTILHRLIDQLEVLCGSDAEELSLSTTELTEEERSALREVLERATKEANNLVKKV